MPCQQKYGSALAQVMAWCLTAPGHYLNHADLSSKVFCGIHIRAIWQVLVNLIHNVFRDYTLKYYHISRGGGGGGNKFIHLLNCTPCHSIQIQHGPHNVIIIEQIQSTVLETCMQWIHCHVCDQQVVAIYKGTHIAFTLSLQKYSPAAVGILYERQVLSLIKYSRPGVTYMWCV